MSTNAALTLSKDARERRVTTTEKLFVPLTDAELLERGQRLTQAMEDRADLKDEAKDAADRYKSQDKVLEAEASILARAISTRREYREVDVEEAWHYDVGHVTRTRLDTGAIVSTREMTFKEKQTEMELHDEK